ncbi:hypothetical protein [Prescottella equi]|uniref:hypothetical protein n=1 Tax=Rhodococcus hoagii TaxID=43767 RepID=UPI001F1F8183|nr:hypothetical protein [Prescottella equi]
MATTTVHGVPSDLVDFEAEFIGVFAYERKSGRAVVRLRGDGALGQRRTGAS